MLLIYFEKLNKEEPSDYRIHYLKGLCNIGLGNPNQAAASVYKSIELKPDYNKARLLLSDIYFRQGSFELAINQTSKILNLIPKYYRARMIRGNAYVALKKYEKAEKDYLKLIEINPKDPIGYYRLGLLKTGSRNFIEAEPLLEKAYDLNHKLIDVFALRVRNALAQKKYQRAHDLCIQQMQNVKENRQLLAFVYNIQAKVFLAEKNTEKAISNLIQAIEIEADYLNSYKTLAGIYLSQKNVDQAKKQYKAIINKNTKTAFPHMMLGTMLEAEKNFTAAEKHYRRALEINPHYAAAANNLSYHLSERTDKYDEALSLAKIAKAKFPNDPGIMDTMGYAYYRKGLFGNAVAEFMDSLEKKPANPIVRYHLGLAYLKKGDSNNALKELTKAIEINANFPGANNARNIIKEIKKK